VPPPPAAVVVRPSVRPSVCLFVHHLFALSVCVFVAAAAAVIAVVVVVVVIDGVVVCSLS